MSGYSTSEVCTPPELPSYLKGVYDLKPILGVPSEEEVMAIHAVIRIAHKFIDVPEICNPRLLSQLSGHLFDVQMDTKASILALSFQLMPYIRHRNFPPHLSASLEPVSGLPTDEEIMKVQNAVWSYQRFADIPTMFDPPLQANLSQHLFDLQMERYLRTCRLAQSSPVPQEPSTAGFTSPTQDPRGRDKANSETNNPGRGADPVSLSSAQCTHDAGTREAIERSNQLAERANQLAERSNLLIERSNQIAERANQLVEQSHRTAEMSGKDAERTQELFERLDRHLGRSEQDHEQPSRITQELTQPLATIGDVLRNINKVLVGIQHAIIRNRRDNKLGALDCLVNEKGETPGESTTTSKTTFEKVFRRCYVCPEHQLRVVIGGLEYFGNISDPWLGNFLGFYGIGEGLCDETGTVVKAGQYHLARERLREYLSSCLG